MSISDVQTMGDFGTGDSGDDAPIALRTPLYLIIAALGALIFISSFLPWAGVKVGGEGNIVGGPSSGYVNSMSGLDAGGWGLSALIAGLVIAALGVLGYFWNPFSDPEALFIAGFAAVTAIAAVIKLIDTPSLWPVASDFDSVNASARMGLWLILLGSLTALLSAVWILYSRPKAQSRLTT